MIAAFGKLTVLRTTGLEQHDPGGPAERFFRTYQNDYLDLEHVINYHHTEVAVVVDAGVLEMAAQAAAGQRSVLLWGGDDIVSRASTFRMALEATWSEPELECPQFGGFYVPDVLVYKHSDGREIRPFRTAMVYAEPSALASSAWNDKQFQLYLGYMHEQVCRVLAFCSFKAHDEIVLEAWGCDGAIPSVEQSEGLAQMFKDARMVGCGWLDVDGWMWM